MFNEILDVIVAALQRINTLRYIRNILIARENSPDKKDIWVTDGSPEFGDFGELYIPVNAPEQPPPTPVSDYRPLPDQPLVLRLRPRVVIPTPSSATYDPTRIALGCIHALTFTDGALPSFMSQKHDLPPAPGGIGNTGFMWATYKLDTLKVLRVGPIATPAGMEVQLVIEGMILLHPPTGPVPTFIAEIRPPAEPPPPAAEIPRGVGQIVRVVDDTDD
jgi:hypothetical protein